MAKQVKVSAPAAAAVAEKPATKVHKVPAGSITGGKPVPSAKEQVKQKAGPEAQGFSLAQSAIAEVRGHGNLWISYVARLAMLEPEARKYFVERIEAHNRQLMKEAKGTDKKLSEQAGATLRSAKTRLSELTTLSKALDAGYEVPSDGVDSKGLPKVTVPFYTVIAEARLFKDAAAKKDGTGAETRGRTPDSMPVAVIKYVNKREIRSNDDKIARNQILDLLKKHFPEAFAMVEGDGPEEGDPSDGILRNASKMAA